MMDKTAQRFAKYSDTALTIALLVAAAILVAIALWRNHTWVKAIALAWITLP